MTVICKPSAHVLKNDGQGSYTYEPDGINFTQKYVMDLLVEPLVKIMSYLPMIVMQHAHNYIIYIIHVYSYMFVDSFKKLAKIWSGMYVSAINLITCVVSKAILKMCGDHIKTESLSSSRDASKNYGDELQWVDLAIYWLASCAHDFCRCVAIETYTGIYFCTNCRPVNSILQ